MQAGKCWERFSMLAAVMGAPREVSLSEMWASGVAKFFERCVRIGERRSSSSRRGRARAVSCGVVSTPFHSQIVKVKS